MGREFTLRCAEDDDDVARVAGFLQGIFGHGRDYVLNHPDVRRPQSVRWIEHEGAVVSAHVLEHIELSLGQAWVPAARIELVATDVPFRRKGLCRRLLDNSLEALKSEGTKIALIFGYPFFRALGFEYCIPTYEQERPAYCPPGSAIIPTRGLSGFKTSQPPRAMTPEDLPKLAEVHSKGNPPGNLSRRRCQEYWKHLVRHRAIETYRVCENASAVTGYVRVESGRGWVHAREAVAMDDAACESILGHLHAVAEVKDAEAVVFHCPHSGTMGNYLRLHGAAEYAAYAERKTNLQMKVLDLRSCLRVLQPELSQRVAQSEFCGADGRYNLVAESARIGLLIRNGSVIVSEAATDGEDLRISDRRMAQLLAGFRSQEPTHHRLLDVLFPPGEPYWYADDI